MFYKKLLFQSLYFQIKFDKCIKYNKCKYIHKLHLSKVQLIFWTYLFTFEVIDKTNFIGYASENTVSVFLLSTKFQV